MSTTFTENTLIITYLPDLTRNGAIVPVAGVVVSPDEQETVIRVRDLVGNTKEITVSNELLSKR